MSVGNFKPTVPITGRAVGGNSNDRVIMPTVEFSLPATPAESIGPIGRTSERDMRTSPHDRMSAPCSGRPAPICSSSFLVAAALVQQSQAAGFNDASPARQPLWSVIVSDRVALDLEPPVSPTTRVIDWPPSWAAAVTSRRYSSQNGLTATLDAELRRQVVTQRYSYPGSLSRTTRCPATSGVSITSCVIAALGSQRRI